MQIRAMQIRNYKLSTEENLYIALLADITDTHELKKKIQDQSLQCCCITPSLILNTFQIAIAADKACLAKTRSKLITKNVYTEILYNLSTSKHITKSLMRFGVQENDKNVIVAVIGTEDDLNKELSKVGGNPITLDKLDELNSKNDINKEYNIKERELEESSQLDSVITRIATKHL